MLIGRIKYKRDWKFVFQDEDRRFLRIVDGSSILHMRPTDRLVMYRKDFMLSPVKPGKLIAHDFRYIRPTTSVVSPFSSLLLPDRTIETLHARPSIYLVVGDDERPVFAWGIALSIILRRYGDVRDFAMDTFYIVSEFVESGPYSPVPYRITIRGREREDTISAKTLPVEMEEVYRKVKRFFLLYPQDAIGVDMDWSIILRPGDRISMESPLGKIETRVEFKE